MAKEIIKKTGFLSVVRGGYQFSGEDDFATGIKQYKKEALADAAAAGYTHYKDLELEFGPENHWGSEARTRKIAARAKAE
ncbi:MAG: hypothetical protein AB7U25_26145 [Vicinamibacterales bacterium]